MIRRCQHPDENWLCLCCKEVLCSRFVNKHMLEHYQEELHNLALSYRFFTLFWDYASLCGGCFSLLVLFLHCTDWSLLSLSDLSVWCFSCEAYLDAQVIQQLRPAYETAYILKFGSPPPFRSIEHLQNADEEANTSTGNWGTVHFFVQPSFVFPVLPPWLMMGNIDGIATLMEFLSSCTSHLSLFMAMRD